MTTPERSGGRRAEVAALTVAYHSDAVLPDLMNSLDSASSRPVDLVIVNNATDEPGLAERLPPRARTLVREAGENLGYGRAINGAAKEVPDAEWLLVVNPDVRLSPGAIDELINVAESDPRIGVVGPLILSNGAVYPSARRLPSLRTGIGHAALGGVWPQNPWTRSYHAGREHPPREREAGWLSGSCLLLRGSLFRDLGGFDESYFMYFEDVDLCARIGAAGYRVVYAPSAKVEHIGAHSTGGSRRAMLRAHHDSAYRYLSRRYHRWYLWPLRITLGVGLKLRTFLASR